MRIKFLTTTSLITLNLIFTQEKLSLSTAQKYIEMGNMNMAITILKRMIEKGEKQPDVFFYLGYCYVNVSYYPQQAVDALNKYLELSKNPDNNAYYLLGKAYHLNYQFDSALTYYRKFIAGGGGRLATRQKTEQDIQHVLNARELIKYPLNVKIENLGAKINTPFPEYMPLVDKEETFILFNTRREDGSLSMPDGYFSASIYAAFLEKGQVKKVIPLGSEINTIEDNEEITGMSPSGNYIVIHQTRAAEGGTLYLSRLLDRTNEKLKFSYPVPLPPPINSSYNEISGTITDDASTIIFSSDRPEGLGDIDLYIAKKLPNGEWGNPHNLGPPLNTKYEDNFPYLSPDSKTLFFASSGHISMGGLDIFKATFNENSGRWENIKNLGYPVNTTADDILLSMPAKGRYAYIASFRKDGFGDLDIYRVTFLDVEPIYKVITGRVFTKDTSTRLTDVTITSTNTETGKLIGYYQPNPVSMKYVIILPPGKYSIDVQAPGFTNQTFILSINEGDENEQIINIELIPKR